MVCFTPHMTSSADGQTRMTTIQSPLLSFKLAERPKELISGQHLKAGISKLEIFSSSALDSFRHITPHHLTSELLQP
jgi:hypothetical protein